MKSCHTKHFRHLLATTLAVSSSLGMISSVLAQQTAPGTAIRNTATAEFSDGTNTYNATSNEVVITVAEVAGITVTANDPINSNPIAGAQIYVDFVITNTGNDPTQFFIPSTATLSGTGATGSTVGTLQILAVNGNPLPNAVNVTAGADTGTLLGGNGSIGVGGTVTVRVPVNVAPGATQGQTINVALGNTNPVDAQNQDRTGNISTNDVYTVDNNDGATNETNGAPVNGVREAMATSKTITVGAREQAFSTILKAVSSYSTGTRGNDVSDDILTYGLALKVEDPTPPPNGLVASNLHGTKLNGLDPTKAYVLVSDAIPTGMKLNTTNPTPASRWQVVYTSDPLATNALNATWTINRPTSVTRVGFVYDTTTNGALPKGAPAITGMSFSVTPDTGFTGGQIANIAQTFGQSQPGNPVPGTSTQIVYDESGDQTYNNGLDGANPDPATGGTSSADGGITDGQANPSVDGTDPGNGNDPTAGNTNTGTNGNGNGTKPNGGETTVFTVAATPLNGPNGQPGATGPSGSTNDDFTNKSILGINKPSNEPLTDTETPEVVFTNTIRNTNTSPQEITLLPTPPTGTDTLLDGTLVTITAGGQTASYTYTGGEFVPTNGNPPVKIAAPAGDPTDTTKGLAQYEVTVNLPAAPQFTGYSVPITAFIDVDKNGQFNNEPNNVTIDRVYTNYLRLEKKARLLESDGTTRVIPTDGSFTTDQTALAAAATPGRIIEYQITYTNVSTGAGSGTGSVILPANNLVITENGTAGNNTWFNLTLDPKYPTPANGTAVDPQGTITVTTAANGAVTDIQTYTNTVTSVAPQGTGTFTFQRKIK
jgi:hypothetical protein